MPRFDPRSGADAAAEPCTPLRVGDALAVLLAGIPDAPGERTAAAERALRTATGREDLAVGRRPSGRPRLSPPYPELGVSLSHRVDLLLAAFSPTRHVGVDIEIATPGLDPKGIAADYFSTAEAGAIAPLAEPEACEAFLRLWVAKEAALKLTGRGIYDGVNEPDLGAQMARLLRDGEAMDVMATPRLPSMRIAVCRIELPARPAIYCGLAVASA